MVVEPTPSLWMSYYHRRLECADFSLQANTEDVPETGYFYLLRGGEVLLRTVDYSTADAAYRDLCRQHWEERIASESPAERMSSAWGLLGLEPAHRAANGVIEQDGTQADRARLAKMRMRQRAQLKHRARNFGRGRS